MIYVAKCTRTPATTYNAITNDVIQHKTMMGISAKYHRPGTWGGFDQALGSFFLAFDRSFVAISEPLKVPDSNPVSTTLDFLSNHAAVSCGFMNLIIWKLTPSKDTLHAEPILSISNPPSYTFQVSSNDHPTLLCADLNTKTILVNYIDGSQKDILFPSLYKDFSLAAYNHPVAFLSSKQEVIAFNLETNAQVFHFPVYESSSIFIQRDRIVIISGKKGKIRDLNNGKEICSFKLPEKDLSYSFNNDYFVFAQANTMLVYNKNGKCKAKYSTVAAQPTELNAVESISCHDNKLAISLFRESPIILHFDELDSPPAKIVELKPDGTTHTHTFSAFSLYDSIADLMDGKIRNISQFVRSHSKEDPNISRIYMVAVVGECITSLTGKFMSLLSSVGSPNPIASSFMNKPKSEQDHTNILWPVCKRHIVPIVETSEIYGVKYEVKGSAFFFKEARESHEKPWALTDLSEQEVLAIK
mmetsp:Transcript_20731/g.29108  ORF Transcript_20731/g.29108 Transcript_20731/m.29108 type:complete len:472 (+) Transcript_20731:124-1539(+)